MIAASNITLDEDMVSVTSTHLLNHSLDRHYTDTQDSDGRDG